MAMFYGGIAAAAGIGLLIYRGSLYEDDSNHDDSHVPSKFYSEYMAKLADTAKGKTIVITGSTQGLGLIFAKAAAKLGASKLILLNRRTSSADVLAEIEAAGKAKIVEIICDQMEFASVRKAAAAVIKECGSGGLDVLCCNSGIMAVAEAGTVDGYDVQMQTNHLGHFLLTKLLMPSLEAAADKKGDARVITHTSGARHMGGATQKKYFEKWTMPGSLGGDGRSMIPPSGPWVRYAQTKLANLTFAFALAKKQSKVKALSACPGISITNLQKTAHKKGNGMRNFDLFVARKMSHSNKDATLPLITAAFAPEAVSGTLYVPRDGEWGPPKAAPEKGEKNAMDASQQEMLWAASEDAVGEKF